MRNLTFLAILFLHFQIIFSQIEKEIFRLGPISNLITEEIKKTIDQNIIDKPIVFLGEAVHYSGSDILAKIEFLKYLILEHGYKDIAFESDFFALLFDHDKQNLYSIWSKSKQCIDLFNFLEENNVTIWGFDNRIYSTYSYQNFSRKLIEQLNKSNLELNENFQKLAKILIQNQYNSRKRITKKELEFLIDYTNNLLKNPVIASDPIWNQILNSFKSAILLYTVKDNNSDFNRINIRDKQMAKNLDFLIKQNPGKKFIVWLANAHMSKSNSKKLQGQTMGYEFRLLNPNSSYHIAVGSIRLSPRTEKDVKKASKNNKSILSILPSLDKNYFIDTEQLTNNYPEFNQRIFNDLYIFNLGSNKTKLFSHFDALVLIANGEDVKYIE